MKSNTVAVRVIDVIYNDKHPRFEQLGGWDSIGVVFYAPIDNSFHITREVDTLPYAYPLDSNITTFPLKNEIIFTVDGPSREVVGAGSKVGVKYWTDKIGVWNSIHHNAYPAYNDRQVVGQTFNEQTIIQRKIPLEGDTLIQSRYGGHIRLGSTNIEQDNPWSTTGDTGDPIITIGANSPDITRGAGPIGVFEHTNDNGSGTFYTTTQKIPSTLELEFIKVPNQIQPNEYTEPQIYNYTTRLTNDVSDSIINHAQNVIYQQSLEYSIVSEDMYVNSERIYLGENAVEQGVLGNRLFDTLSQIIEALQQCATLLSTVITPPPGTPLLQVNQAGVQLQAELAVIRTYLSEILAAKTYIE